MIIEYHIFNSIDSVGIMKIAMPWNYRKAVMGFYSNLWRDLKINCASISKVDKRFVKAEIVRNKKGITDRFEISLPSGVRFNSPFDLNETDFKIINLHLEALKLTIN